MIDIRLQGAEYCHNVWYEKNRMMWLPAGEKTFWRYVYSFRQNTRTWQTPRQTDRRTDMHRTTPRLCTVSRGKSLTRKPSQTTLWLHAIMFIPQNYAAQWHSIFSISQLSVVANFTCICFLLLYCYCNTSRPTSNHWRNNCGRFAMEKWRNAGLFGMPQNKTLSQKRKPLDVW